MRFAKMMKGDSFRFFCLIFQQICPWFSFFSHFFISFVCCFSADQRTIGPHCRSFPPDAGVGRWQILRHYLRPVCLPQFKVSNFAISVLRCLYPESLSLPYQREKKEKNFDVFGLPLPPVARTYLRGCTNLSGREWRDKSSQHSFTADVIYANVLESHARFIGETFTHCDVTERRRPYFVAQSASESFTARAQNTWLF